jgi:hypothetical protein
MKQLLSSVVVLATAIVVFWARNTAAFLGCETPEPYPASMQEEALQKFYKGTGGPTKWPAELRTGWDHPGGICAFDGNAKAHGYNPYGTRCLYGGFHPAPPKGDGGVMYLDHLSGMAEGELPEEFKAFWMIIHIELHGNKLYGKLWDTSKHCFLSWVDISNNKFSGSLPDNFFASSGPHLELLNFGYNQFEGSLPAVANTWVQMTSLLLNNNKFSGALPDMSHLHQMRHLNLQSNSFSGSIGPWFKELENLAWVEIDNNQFTGSLPPLPPKVSRFTANGNKFSGTIPDSYANNGYLRWFECNGCDLQCPTPDFLAHLSFSTHCKPAKSRQWE